MDYTHTIEVALKVVAVCYIANLAFKHNLGTEFIKFLETTVNSVPMLEE